MSLFSTNNTVTPLQQIGASIGQGDPYMDIGKALGLVGGSMFGAFPAQNKKQQQLRFMQELDQQIDWSDPQSIVQASQLALDAGYVDLATNLYEKSIGTKNNLADIRTTQLIGEGAREAQAEQYLSTISSLTTLEEYKKALGDMRKAGLGGTAVYSDLQATFATFRKEQIAAEREAAEREAEEAKEAKRVEELGGKIKRGEEKTAEQIRQFEVRQEAEKERAEARLKRQEEADIYKSVINPSLAEETAGTFLMQIPPQNVDDSEVIVIQRAMGADFKKYDNILSTERGVTPSVAQQYYPLIREEAYDPGSGFGIFGEKASYSSPKFTQIADGVFGRKGGAVSIDVASRLSKKNGLIVGVSRIKDANGKVRILDQKLLDQLRAYNK